MGPYEALDFYHLDDLLTDDERQVRDTVRRFGEQELLPKMADCVNEGRFPTECIKPLAALGLFGATLTEPGLPGTSHTAYGLAMQELERIDSGIRSFASVQSALVMYPIATYGSAEQKARWLGPLHRGEAIGCFGLTEPNHGSDPGGMTTRAERVGDGFRLNGVKTWITNGHIAQVAVVWAKLDDEIAGFLVPTDTPGFTANPIGGKFSMRASATSELVLDGAAVGADAILPGAVGLKAALACLSQARFGIAFGVIGAAQACFDEARQYALDRVQFGKPIASFQLVQNKLVTMATEITKAQWLAWRLGKLHDAGRAKHFHISMAKRNNAAIALDIARSARDILGANGISYEYQTARHLTNLETVYTYEGTHDIHGLIVGKELTGIDAIS
jgi:glutaryl-CoA dehydrogenase